MGRRDFARTAPDELLDSLTRLGQHIYTARINRGLTETELAARAGISRPTLRAVERGQPGTAIAAYAAMLWAMNLHHALDDIASPANDPEGATLLAARTGRPGRQLDDDF